jgi:Mce-associated membrane protein
VTPSWYDVLEVEPDASVAEIRAAWKAGVADLDPTDRRFRLLNKAAEVLLDEERRAEHDRALAADAAEEAAQEAGEQEGEPDPATTTARSAVPLEADAPAADEAVPVERGGRGPGVVTTGVLGLLAVLLLVATVISFVAGGASDSADSATSSAADGLPDAREVAAARAAAEAAIVPVLSYDYRQLEQDKQAAISYMTPEYAGEYEQLFEAVVAVNAPSTETVVSVEVLESGIVRTGEDLVDVLLFVNRPTTNKQQTTPVIYKDQATVRMRDIGGEWLVDCLIAGSGGTCES